MVIGNETGVINDYSFSKDYLLHMTIEIVYTSLEQ